MGSFFSKLFDKLKKDKRIVLVGLDAAGKTTILYKLKLNTIVTTVPTIGFNTETIDYKGLRITAWDIGGQEKIRKLWIHYYRNTDAVIFVIDSSNNDVIDSVTDELEQIYSQDELAGVPILFYANKQDATGAMSVKQLVKLLNLEKLTKRRWYMQGSNALDGSGLYEGLDWLVKEMNERPIKHN